MSDPVFTAWARLLRAQTHLLGVVERELKQAGLPPLGWYDVLLELSRPGCDGLRPVELEKLLLLAQYNLSRLLDRLEKAGLVERRAVAGRPPSPAPLFDTGGSSRRRPGAGMGG